MEYFGKCWINCSERLTSWHMKCGGYTLYHRHHSNILNKALDVVAAPRRWWHIETATTCMFDTVIWGVFSPTLDNYYSTGAQVHSNCTAQLQAYVVSCFNTKQAPFVNQTFEMAIQRPT